MNVSLDDCYILSSLLKHDKIILGCKTRLALTSNIFTEQGNTQIMDGVLYNTVFTE